MQKILLKIFLVFVIFLSGMFLENAFAQEVLQGFVMKVPDNFYGIWRVQAYLVETEDDTTFKKNSIDLWNIFADGDVIKLRNPFSGAEAEISIEDVDKEVIIFVKKGNYNNKILTDRVEIQINQDEFVGVDYIELQTKSEVDGSVIKTQTAKYKIKGERIAGQQVKGE